MLRIVLLAGVTKRNNSRTLGQDDYPKIMVSSSDKRNSQPDMTMETGLSVYTPPGPSISGIPFYIFNLILHLIYLFIYLLVFFMLCAYTYYVFSITPYTSIMAGLLLCSTYILHIHAHLAHFARTFDVLVAEYKSCENI